MLKDVQVVALEGGALRVFATGEKSREAVLALPLNRLIVKMVRVSSGQDMETEARTVLQSLSPFPDEQLTVSCETVRETDGQKIVIAAALPEGATDDIAEQLDAAKLNVTRIDAQVFGELRGLWNQLQVSDSGRRLVLIKGVDCISAIVLDGDAPCAIRAIVAEDDLRREIMLCLLEAEDFGGASEVKEIVCAAGAGEGLSFGEEALAAAATFAPVRQVSVVDADDALRGVAERTQETGTLDALPASWREVLEETRFKAKLIKNLSIAGGIWAVIMGVLFGVPLVYGYMTNYQKGLCKAHARQYKEVKEMKGKVDLIRKYSDHTRGALEIMKALSDRLPEGIELNSWNFKREDGVRISGEAETANEVYSFKDQMIELGGEDRVFASVELGPLSAGKGGRQRFDLDCRYEAKEAE